MKNLYKRPVILAVLVTVSCSCTYIESDWGDLPNPGNPSGSGEVTYEVYDAPQGFQDGENPLSSIWKVSIIQNGIRKESPVFSSLCPAYQLGYQGMSDKDKNTLDYFKGRSINWSTFSFSGKVTVEVEILDEGKVTPGTNVNILPSRYGITPEVEGNVIRFDMDKPGYCSVEVGVDGYRQGLMIFADPLEDEVPTAESESYCMLENASAETISSIPTSASGIWFKPGVHDIGVYKVPANIKNIYIPGGAWVYGAIILENEECSDVHIFGRGVLSGRHLNYRESHSIEARNSEASRACASRIRLEGVTVADNKYFAVRLIGTDNVVSHVKCIGGWTYNCDGIAAFANSTVSDCFIWANDDNIKVYRDNVKVSDVVCWQLDNGGVIQLGWTSPMSDGVEIRRVDVLHAEYRQWQFNVGLLSLVGNRYNTPGVSGWTKNMLIEDVVTETPIPVLFNITPDSYTPYVIDGLTLRNWKLKYADSFKTKNRIEELQSGHKFSNIIFDGVSVNGTELSGSNWRQVGNFSDDSVSPEFL
ncbi:MAG: hypothetical protein ACI4TM_05540 [Candidatus Cryptobacteroides sp.]